MPEVTGFSPSKELGKIPVCEDTVASTMPIGSPTFALHRPSEGSLVTPRPAFSVLRGSSEQEISLGFVEGLNTKIRIIQRRAYGLRDEDYLRLKILACMLPEI